MISFLKNWIEQIVISVIIVSIFELLIPNGKIKKYIKVVLGIYIIFCIISPFVNSTELYNISEVNLDEYIQNMTKTETVVNQESMDLRLQDLYIEQLENDVKKKVEEKRLQCYKM